ncbi:MAG TPA: ATP-binding protein [Vicinamibacterales bacterium]|nr:ATP-binding protein [Vicinamibacterales bacterium]
MAAWRQRLARTLGLRLTLWYAGIFLASVTAVGLAAYWLLGAALERRDHQLLLEKLASYAARYEAGGVPAVSRAVSDEQAAGSPDLVLVRLVGPGADLRFFSVPAAWTAFDLASLDGPVARDGDEWHLLFSARTEAPLEVVSHALSDGAVIQVGRTTLGREGFLLEVRRVLGVMVGLVLLAGLAGGAALTLSGLRPLRDLRDAVRDIARTGRLGARVETSASGDLVDELGQVFNEMSARIEALVEGMRGALDNVAHDLRTPVARLRARAESALAAGVSDETARETLAECVEEADRVMALLTTLMDISEAETGTMRLSLDAVPVDEAVRDTLDLYEDIADDRGIALRADVPAGLIVRADRQRFRQVLANLVDNALKYTPRGGSVVVSSGRDGQAIAIAVTDTGVGIAPDDLPRIFDRLYRGQAPGAERGLGLGLSLVRAIVTAHGGTVDVESAPGQGATFRVRLPAENKPGLFLRQA